jgi:hypothetical protein
VSTSLPERTTRTAGRTSAIAAGTILGALAVTLVAVGGALLAMHSSKRDADGFYSTGQKTLATSTHAMVADKIDVGGDGPGWLFSKSRLGTIRVTARGTSAKPVFIGIARTAQVNAYLHGVAQDEITDLEVDPLGVTYHRRPGTATPSAPGGQTFWASRAGGTGHASVTWPVQKGNWAVVVMNADGTAGVQAPVSVGAKAGFLVWLGAGLLGFGAVLAAGAAACIFGGRRTSRESLADAGAPGIVAP